MRRKSRRLPREFSLVVLLVLLVGLVHSVSLISHHARRSNVQFLSVDCEPFNGVCLGRDQSRSVEVRLPSSEVKSLQSFPVRVTLVGFDAREVTVEFQGVDMYMGFNRITLKRQTDGTFSGAAELVACVTGRMQWRADVVVKDGHGRATGLRFRFWAT